MKINLTKEEVRIIIENLKEDVPFYQNSIEQDMNSGNDDDIKYAKQLKLDLKVVRKLIKKLCKYN